MPKNWQPKCGHCSSPSDFRVFPGCKTLPSLSTQPWVTSKSGWLTAETTVHLRENAPGPSWTRTENQPNQLPASTAPRCPGIFSISQLPGLSSAWSLLTDNECQSCKFRAGKTHRQKLFHTVNARNFQRDSSPQTENQRNPASCRLRLAAPSAFPDQHSCENCRGQIHQDRCKAGIRSFKG
ncbi:MAG: hypothetical protein RLZZ436_1690 [Planctomycetota bacterium]|jgi:hypothetical protein